MSTSRNFRRLKYQVPRGPDSPKSEKEAALLASKRRLEKQHLAIMRKLKFLCLISDEAMDYSVQFNNDYRAAWTEKEWQVWVAKKMKAAGKKSRPEHAQ